ncbi:MAG: DUF2752 domain-containing protein [Phycisphaerales bacterium]
MSSSDIPPAAAAPRRPSSPALAVTARLNRTDRTLAALLTLGSGMVLAIAAWLQPATDGLGTHTQLGLASCQWISDLDTPCPTCGMTTSFAFAAQGDLTGAFLVQPFGAVLALTAAVVFWLGLHASLTGSRAGAALSRVVLRPRVLWPAGVAFLGAWAYKVAFWPG